MEQQPQYQIVPFETVMSMGEVFAKSGYFTDAKEQAQAVVKMLAGQEMGVGPFASMSGIHIIKGKPEVGAHLLAAVLRRSGKYTYEIEQPIKPDKVTLEFFERSEDRREPIWKSLGKSTFTAEDARRAGTGQQAGTMQKYPRNMLFARALSNGVKWYCPDVSLSPLYSRGEIDQAANVVYEAEGKIVEGEVVEEDVTLFDGTVVEEPEAGSSGNGYAGTLASADGLPEGAPTEPEPNGRPWNPDTLKAKLLKRTEQLYDQEADSDGGDEWDEIPAPGHVGVMVGHLNDILGDDDRRHVFLRTVFDDPSSKKLDRAQVQAVLDWIGGQAGMEMVTGEANRLVNAVVTKDAVGELPGMDADGAKKAAAAYMKVGIDDPQMEESNDVG